MSECEFSKPFFDGSIHYRKCLVASGGCGEAGWKHNFQLCITRKAAIINQMPLPTLEELKPDDLKVKLTRTIWEPPYKSET